MPSRRPDLSTALITSVLLATASTTVGAEAATPAGRLVVLDKAGAELQVVDLASGEITTRVPTGRGPHEVAVDPSGRVAYVSNYGDQQPNDSLSVIDLVEGRELRRVELGELTRPHGIVWHDGALLFTSETARAVGRYDPESGTVERFGDTGAEGSHMLVVAPDGGAVWTANIRSGSTTRLTLEGGRAVSSETIAIGPQSEAIAVSPDGREVWLGRNGDGRISVVDTASRKVVSEIEVGGVPIRLAFTPDGKRVVVSDADAGALVLVDVKRRGVRRRIPLGGVPIGVVVRADGAVAWASLIDRSQVAEVDLESGRVIRRIAAPGNPDGIAWLP